MVDLRGCSCQAGISDCRSASHRLRASNWRRQTSKLSADPGTGGTDARTMPRATNTAPAAALSALKRSSRSASNLHGRASPASELTECSAAPRTNRFTGQAYSADHFRPQATTPAPGRNAGMTLATAAGERRTSWVKWKRASSARWLVAAVIAVNSTATPSGDAAISVTLCQRCRRCGRVRRRRDAAAAGSGRCRSPRRSPCRRGRSPSLATAVRRIGSNSANSTS